MAWTARLNYLFRKAMGDHDGQEAADLLNAQTLGATAVVTTTPTTTVGVGAVAGTGNTVVESGNGIVHKTTITLTNTAIALVDQAGVVAYGGLKIYDFPIGAIQVLGALGDLALTKSSAGVNDDWDGDIALGTATATTGATLISTEADIVPSTATPQAVAGATTGDFGGTLSLTALTDSTGGSANNTLEAVPASVVAALTGAALTLADTDIDDTPSHANVEAAIKTSIDTVAADVVAKVKTGIDTVTTAIKNDLADLAAKVNEILTRSIGSGVKVFDGTATAKDCFLNVLVDDTDHDVTSTPCNIIVNGTITLTWVNLGDY